MVKHPTTKFREPGQTVKFCCEASAFPGGQLIAYTWFAYLHLYNTRYVLIHGCIKSHMVEIDFIDWSLEFSLPNVKLVKRVLIHKRILLMPNQQHIHE